MSFSYASAYKKYAAEKKKKHALYKELGMTDEQIEAIDEFDDREFRAECVYRFHMQPLDIPEESEFDDGQNPLYHAFGDILSVEMEFAHSEKYGWLQEIDSPELLNRLLELSEEDLSLLTAFFLEGKTQTTIAKEKGIAQKNICKKLKRIIGFLKNGTET